MIKKIVEKYRTTPSILKASFFFILCGVLKDAVDIIATPIFTRLLTTEEYGLFSVYNSYYQIIRIVVSLYIFSDGYDVGLSRFSEDMEGFTSSMQGLAFALFSGWLAICWGLRNSLTLWTGLSTNLILLMLLQTLFTTPLNCWQHKKRYQYDYRVVTVIITIYLLLQPLLGMLLIKLNPGRWNNGLLRIYAGVGVQVLFGLIICIAQFIKKPIFYDNKYWKFAIMTNIPLLPHYLSQIMLNHSDRLMIDLFVGKAQTAIYTIGHAAAFTLFAFTSNLNATFVPWLYKRLKSGQVEGVKKVVEILITIAAVSSIMLILIAPEAIKILGGSKYADSIWVVPPLTYGVFLIFVYSIMADFELFYGKNHYILVSSVVGTVANILLNYWLIPKRGYIVAGYTTVVGYILMCFNHYYFLRKTCIEKHITLVEVIPVKFMLMLAGVLCIICNTLGLLYPNILIRYAILCSILVLAFINRDRLFGLYRNLKRK